MKKNTSMTKSRRYASRFGKLSLRAFSLCLLFVILLTPILPAFANTDGIDVTTHDAPPALSESHVPDAPIFEEISVEEEDVSVTDEIPTDEDAVSQDEVPLANVSQTNESSVTEIVELNNIQDSIPQPQDIEQESLTLSQGDTAPPTSEILDEDITVLSTTTRDEYVGESFDDTSRDVSASNTLAEVDSESSNEESDSAPTGEEESEVLIPDDQFVQDSSDGVAEAEVLTTQESEAETEVPEEDTATTTESDTPAIAEAHTVGYENTVSFAKTSCTEVGDGSFYCIQPNEDADSNLLHGETRVFSEIDTEGDKEIFVARGEDIVQITSNLYDDDAPRYDDVSDTYVWHRLIDGRYQIITYDAQTGVETQITNDRFNNMEPVRYGERIVWQSWVGSDWDILLYEDDEIVHLSDNSVPDVGPRIHGEYIMWRAFENEAWYVKMFDRASGHTETIADPDGSSIDNPRFVLVYDSKHQNGDVETRGYDLQSGEITPLSAIPVPVPDDLPSPEGTGEERALLQTVTQIKLKTESEDDDLEDVPNTTDTSQNEDGDIVILPFVDADILIDDEASTTEEVSSAPIMPDFDLQIPPTPTATLSNSIEDLFVPPYSPKEASSTDDIVDPHEIIVTEA